MTWKYFADERLPTVSHDDCGIVAFAVVDDPIGFVQSMALNLYYNLMNEFVVDLNVPVLVEYF